MTMPEKLHKQRFSFLILVNRGMGSLGIEKAVESVHAALKEKLGLDAELTASSVWYKEHFSRCGDWDSWIWETVTGKSYDTRKPHFAGFIVCEEKLGRANAQIVDLAVRNKKVVLFCRKDLPLSEVEGTEETDPDNWKQGWKVTLGRVVQ